ncbi:hypothetical protein ACFRCI_42865 [Streptomyces sp. NPDC056638]|uniref:hypothetical protein n=1 Tax=Streptomyces sp. NPDC056638 TaxID=3345887 RepID=UPI003694888A
MVLATSCGQQEQAESAGAAPGSVFAAKRTEGKPPLPSTSATASATVTAWAKGGSGWKSVTFGSSRVGANGVTDGATRRQNTSTTPTGTYTITEGFGVKYDGTNMQYTRVDSSHRRLRDPESAYHNSLHTAAGADFPLVETGDRGSEHLINYPTRYAKALIIDFNRRPATEPGSSCTSTGAGRRSVVSRSRAPRW